MTYADGTEGWAGSDTSRERAERARDDGSATARRRAVLSALDAAGPTGLTWKELGDLMHLHHGSSSSALTNLHKSGLITRTSRKRSRSKVYVLPSNLLDDDTTEAYRPNRNAAQYRAEEAERTLARLEGVIADARLALLTGESSTKVLRILDEK